jgi:predicted nicotinamide N-methyase
MPSNAFIRANTKLLAPPLVPEVRLHLAEESLPIWQKTEAELRQANVPPPYWAFAWAGGQALARYVLDTHIVAGRSVLDVGAGSGLVAIAAMKAGAAHALACDVDALALRATALNARANGVVVATTAADLLGAATHACDVLLVGDLFYERELAERVLNYIEAAQRHGCQVLVGDPRRSYFPRVRFRAVAEYAVRVTRELEDADISRAAVWRPA